MKRIAIIGSDKHSFFYKYMESEKIKVFSAYYKYDNIVTRNLMKIQAKINKSSIKYWIKITREDLEEFDLIIIFDEIYQKESFLQKVKKIAPGKRIIFWYWNPVRNSINPDLIGDNICEKWTYSLNDSFKYSLKYNGTFYFNEFCDELNNYSNNYDYDVFFVGRDKNRLSELLKLKNKFEKMGLKIYFHVTANRWFLKYKNKYYRDNMPYKEVINCIKKSKAILDVIQNQEDGLSLRVMESIFLKRKLITNSLFIKKYDFYNPKNIFVLGEDDLEKIPNFLSTPFERIDKEIVKAYHFNSWIKRFEKV